MSLEPIEEKDLDMQNKFIENNHLVNDVEQVDQSGAVSTPENKVEKIEGVIEKDDAYAKIVSKIKTQTPQTDEADVAKDIAIVGKTMDAESRINNLVDIAMQKGVVHAVKVAKQIEDNYILDGLHDKLMADDLHDALMAKGLIEEL